MVWKLIPPREGGHECEELNNRMDSTAVLIEMGIEEEHMDKEKRKNYFPDYRTLKAARSFKKKHIKTMS